MEGFEPPSPAPTSDAYVSALPEGAKKLVKELDPVFHLFGIKADYRNFFKTLNQITDVLSSEHGNRTLLNYIMQYAFHSFDKVSLDVAIQFTQYCRMGTV